MNRVLRTAALALTLVCALPIGARAAFDYGEGICETTATTGTGTVDLAGASGNYLTFASQIASGSTTTYTITSGDGKYEWGVGTFTDAAPDTLSRTPTYSTDGAATALSLTGTSTVCQSANFSFWNTAIAGVSFATVLAGTSSSQTVPAVYGNNDITALFSGFSTGTSPVFGGARFSANATSAATINLGHSRGATVGAYDISSSGDDLGGIAFFGSDTTDFETAAAIIAEVDGTPSNGTDMPGRLSFCTSPDGTAVPVCSWIIDNAGVLKPSSDSTYDIGTSSLGVDQAFVDNLEIGTATDTTITRLSAGNVGVEGSMVKRVGTETIWVPANAMACLAPQQYYIGPNSVYPIAAYDASADEFCAANFVMPKSWNEGTIVATFYWMHPATATNFAVVWGMACHAFTNDDALTGGTYSYTNVTDTGGTTSDLYISSATAAITVAGTPTAGKMVNCAIKRTGSNGSDTLAVDAYLVGTLITYTSDAANDD